MSEFHVVVVGAGLVGALSAISFARQGYTVSLYEARSDPRASAGSVGRSINLAVSARGLGAIRSIDPELCDRITKNSIPMKGRMIHSNGKQDSQIYGLFGECINSIDRSQLNIDLLDEADGYDTVSLHFNHKLVSANFDGSELEFEIKKRETAADQKDTKVKVHADLTIGCDGAYSAVRTWMMKAQRMNFEQEYIEHAYLELSILPTDGGNFALDKHHLHIWPRQEFMLIALPNPDGSFTSTLFAPFKLFDSLTTSQDVVSFFKREFPDALHLIGEGRLLNIWEQNPVAPLIQIKCSPYHLKNRAILLGDATHAMVPFYGQGMNCGFEDLRVLNKLLAEHGVTSKSTQNLEFALQAYSDTRHDDLLAILKLAMGNYIEMRSSVTSKLYLVRKAIDSFLGRVFKDRWIPMYSMVSFRDDLAYTQVIKRQKKQDGIVQAILYGAITTVIVSIASVAVRRSSLGGWRQGVRSLLQRVLSHV